MSQVPDMNTRLKEAVNSVAVPPFLDAKIRNQIRIAARPRSWALRLAPVSIAAAICVGIFTAYQLGHLRITAGQQESYISTVSLKVASIMRVGLGDHLHCSIFLNHPKKAWKAEEMVAKLGTQFAGLIPIVRKHVPQQYEMMYAHRCHYHNREFTHLSLKDGSNLLSVVITRKSPGESFETEGLLPALVQQSGIPMYQADVQRFAMSSFETRDFLVYFISDLPQAQNTDMLVAMSPEMRDFLNKLEI
jgi:hypothetical protein